MLLPHLKITPDRLFDTYTFDQKAKIVKGFLFDKKGHCQLDTEVLGLDGQKNTRLEVRKCFTTSRADKRIQKYF
ncbi:MAG: hypothetical protein ACLRRS_11330 [Faecalibacterium prausnitzii]